MTFHWGDILRHPEMKPRGGIQKSCKAAAAGTPRFSAWGSTDLGALPGVTAGLRDAE